MVDLTRAEIEALAKGHSLHNDLRSMQSQQAITQLLAQLDAAEAKLTFHEYMTATRGLLLDAETARADAAAGQMREIITLAKRAVDQDKSIARERGWNEIDIAKRFANQDTVIRCAEFALPLASPKRGEAADNGRDYLLEQVRAANERADAAAGQMRERCVAKFTAVLQGTVDGPMTPHQLLSMAHISEEPFAPYDVVAALDQWEAAFDAILTLPLHEEPTI